MKSGLHRVKMRGVTCNAAAYREPSRQLEREEADMAVDVAIEEGVAVVTMNRPQALNAFITEQLDLLGAAFHALSQDRSVRVVILTGEGIMRSPRAPISRRWSI